MTSSRALRPWQLSGPPRPPLSARQCLRLTTSARLSVPATARTMTSPPSPPSPPSGPPRGTYFSRRKLQQPAPPSPPLTKSVTRSTNIVIHCGISYPHRKHLLYDTGSGRKSAASIVGWFVEDGDITYFQWTPRFTPESRTCAAYLVRRRSSSPSSPRSFP